jgi:hypothetical protein
MKLHELNVRPIKKLIEEEAQKRSMPLRDWNMLEENGSYCGQCRCD